MESLSGFKRDPGSVVGYPDEKERAVRARVRAKIRERVRARVRAHLHLDRHRIEAFFDSVDEGIFYERLDRKLGNLCGQDTFVHVQFVLETVAEAVALELNVAL